MEIIWLILLIFNIILYGAICFGIMRKSTFTCISIRSPKLLILNNIGNLFMSLIIIISQFFDNGDSGKKIVSIFYYLTNFLLIIPFCLRFQRIVKCCQIQKDERADLQELYNKRYLYEENYYIKFTLILFAILTVILIIFDAVKAFDDPFTANFLFCKDIDLILVKKYLWLAINFIEHIILLTYAYKICVNQLKQKLRFEIVSFFIIWLLYSNIAYIFERLEINNIFIICISLGVCYLFLIINAILPILISFSYKYSTGYHFTPKLMNNLYLFLSNEICYKEFSNYLSTLQGNGSYYLKLYIQIMNYKLGFKLNVDNEQGYQEALAIRDAYFSNANMDNILSKNVVDKVKKECEGLVNNNHFTEGMFDDALQYCFTELGKLFNEFRKTDKFKELYEEFYITSYIQCKMCNVGLINKF
jgi:hypothetical protein